MQISHRKTTKESNLFANLLAFYSLTSAAPDLPHPEDMLTIIPCLFGIIRGMKWRNILAIPFTFVSITLSNSSSLTSQIFLFWLIVPALFTTYPTNNTRPNQFYYKSYTKINK